MVEGSSAEQLAFQPSLYLLALTTAVQQFGSNASFSLSLHTLSCLPPSANISLSLFLACSELVCSPPPPRRRPWLQSPTGFALRRLVSDSLLWGTDVCFCRLRWSHSHTHSRVSLSAQHFPSCPFHSYPLHLVFHQQCVFHQLTTKTTTDYDDGSTFTKVEPTNLTTALLCSTDFSHFLSASFPKTVCLTHRNFLLIALLLHSGTASFTFD